MVVHLSPKAKALTLPLNWSQFLKTLIGAENYTLFQLPPHKTGVRPSSFTRSRYTLLPLFSSFARFLPLGYFFFRHEQSFEISRMRGDEHRQRVEFYWETRCEIGRPITRWSVDRLRNEVSVSIIRTSPRNSGSRHACDKSACLLRKKSSASTFVSNGTSRLPF